VSGLEVNAAVVAALATCTEHAEELGRLDAVAGDGDHGTGMVRGFEAASEATAASTVTTGSAIIAAGDAFADAAGGASGALWGVFLRAIGKRIGDGDVSPEVLVAALRAGQDQIERVGKARPGDKTMLDTLVPFIDALEEAVRIVDDLGPAWSAALEAARDATGQTADMVARRGRSSVLGEQSRGTVDPGARSLLLVLERVGQLLEGATDRGS
jgi:dihydroxyacetone kinase phosphoprotein-dependent L subunit